MFVRLHLIEPAAAPAARLFAIRHSQGHLVRDGDGAVVIGTDVVELDKRRRALNVATVAHIVALVPESDVREGEATSLVPDALVGPLAAFLDVGQKALARHMRVEPPLTLDDLRELAYGMGFDLTPRSPPVCTAEAMQALTEAIAEGGVERSTEAQTELPDDEGRWEETRTALDLMPDGPTAVEQGHSPEAIASVQRGVEQAEQGQLEEEVQAPEVAQAPVVAPQPKDEKKSRKARS